MTRVSSQDPGLYFHEFAATQGFKDAVASVPASERRAFTQSLEVAFNRLAFLDGTASVTLDDVRRAAGLQGADEFLGAGDLAALGIAPEAHNALLQALGQTLGKKSNVRIARDAGETAPGQTNQGLGAPVSLGRSRDVAAAMSATSEQDLREFHAKFGNGQSFEDFSRARMSALTDVTRQRGSFPGFTTNDPAHIQRLQGLGYSLVNSTVTKPGVAAPPIQEHVRGGNDFFALGDYRLSSAATDSLRGALQRLNGAELTGVSIEASTDKVNVSPQLRERLNAYLTQAGERTIPTDAQDPTGNQRLGLARSYAVRQFLEGEGVPASAFRAPVVKPDQSTTGQKEDAASRYIDVSLDATKPGAETPAERSYTLVRPPRGAPLPTMTDHVAFAIDMSPSIDQTERVSALQQQLQALERGGFQQVSYDVITFSNRGSPERTSLSGTPTEVVAEMAKKLGIRQSVDQIRAFVNERGPTTGDGSPDEPLDQVSTMLRD